MKNVFVYGAGGHAKVVIDTLEAALPDRRIAFAVDDDPRHHGLLLRSYPIVGPDAIRDEAGIVAIGANSSRLSIAARYQGRLISVIHPRAWTARGVRIGEGSVLMAGAIVNSDARIGDNVIINTGATVDHDCIVGDGAHLAPGCHLCGDVHVGEGAFLGAGTVVKPGVRIGRNVFLHSGTRISKDVPDGQTVRLAPDPA